MELDTCASPETGTRSERAGNESDSKLFQLVRPICVEVMKQPTTKNFQNLSTFLQDIPPELVPPPLVEYIIFPISVHLKMTTKLRQEVRIELCKCLQTILSRWSVTSLVNFLELFTRLNISLGSETEPTKLNQELPEDVLQPLVACIHDLIAKSLSFHLDTLFTQKYVPSVGHSIFMLLQIVTDNSKLSLRLTALNTLDKLVSTCNGNMDACHQMFKFLPGLTTGLRKICTVKPGRHYRKLVLNAMSVFQRVIKVCTRAESPETLQLADLNLSTVLRQISDSFMLSDEGDLRNALSEFSVDLIGVLNGKMPICNEILWNNVLVFACDENEVIAKKSLTCLSSSLLNPSPKSELCNPAVVLTLSRKALNLIKGHDENGCVLLLKRIATTVTITRLPPDVLKEFLQTLTNVISISLIEHTTSRTSKSLEIELELKRHNKVRHICEKLCLNLCKATDFKDIMDQLTELMKDINSAEWISNYQSAALVFIVKSVIQSCLGSSTSSKSEDDSNIRPRIESDEAFTLVSTFVKCLSVQSEVTEKSLQPVKTGTASASAVVGQQQQQTPKFELSRAVYEKYLLEALEILLSLNPEEYHTYMLPEVMYILLEHAGRLDYVFVSNSALQTLQSISPLDSMEQILAENLDLILSELRLRVKSTNARGPAIYSRLPSAVIFLAQYFDFSRKDFVKFAEDIFFQSDYQQNVEEQGKRQVMYAQLFYALITSLRNHSEVSKGQGATYQHQTPESESMASSKRKKTLLARLLEYQKSVGMSVETEDPTAVQESEEMLLTDDVEEEKEKPLPPNPSLALRICNRVLHYLPINNRIAKLTAMDILIHGISILTPHESALLPLAHQIWEYLVPRFEERDFVIVRKSFELLLELCTASKSFLKRRTLTDVFPKLANLLQKLGAESSQVKDKNRVYYTSTQAYKLQLCILQGLAQLCNSIEIHERDLDRVANGCLLYLQPGQHRNLREAAIKLLEELGATEYGSSIWIKLVANGVCDLPATAAVPPHPSFRPIPPCVSERFRKS